MITFLRKSLTSRRGRPLRTVALGIEVLESRLTPSVNVLGYHGGSSSTGQNLGETVFTTSNVNANGFGKLFTSPVDGQVYAQPLVMTSVNITTGPNAGVHNVVFVATEHDSLYAFDSGSGALLWHDTLLPAKHGGTVTSVPAADVGTDDLTPEIGITSTPAIDATTGTIYVEEKTKEVTATDTHYLHWLHAINISNGAEKFGGPVVIADSIGDTFVSGPKVNGTGDTPDGSPAGKVAFDSLRQLNRTALTLANGNIYIGYASHGDNGPYHGWLLGYSASTLKPTAVFNTTPNGSDGGIWQSGGRIAVDSAGFLYLETGNGTFETTLNSAGLPNHGDYGDAFLKLAVDTTSSPSRLNINGWGLKVADYFVPHDQDNLNTNDLDLGSGAPMLLPSTVGSTTHPNLLVGSGKKGTIYLIDTNNMGHFHAASDQIVQELTGNPIEGAFDTPAYFNGHIYYAAEGDTLKEFAISQAHITATPTSQSGDDFLFPGSTPSISANGTMSGIVWTVDHGLGQLRAYQASNVANELYTSDDAAGNRDDLGTPIKFSVATVANSHVYVGTDGALVGYGLFPSISATVSGTTLTLTKVIPGSATFTIQHAASFQGLTVTGSNNTAINGNQTSFTPTGPINSIVVNLGASADTLTIDGNSNGAITLPGGMSIAGTNGIKTITITNTRLIAGKLNVSFTGNGAETIHLTDVNVGGAVGISHLGTGNTSVTIDTNNNALNRFGSLTINNGIGADTNIVEDTNFTGGVAINNGKGAAGNTGQFGGSQNKLLTVNDPNLATIGGSLAITTLSGQSDSEVSDYNILGNATITSGAGIAGQSQGNVIGLQHRRTSGSSGTPIINGNVAIGGSAVNGAPLTINIGTGAVAGDNSLVIGGNLTVNAGGVGSANITLNDLFAATGITSMTLGAMTSGNLVQVQGTSATAVFNGFNLTSNATGSNTFNIQDQAGKIDFAGGVKFQLGAGDDTLNLAADTNNTDGVAGAILEFFSAATFNGGTGTNKKFTANSAGLFTVVTPSFQNFS